MKEVPLDNCKWCNGSGSDGEYGQFPCFDCEATGYEYGKNAEKYFEYQMNEMEKKLIEKGLL